MSALPALLRKEIGMLFSSPIAYALIAVFLALLGYTFVGYLFIAKRVTVLHIFFQAGILLVMIVPLVTMRQFAEERRNGTLELLLTSPVRELEVVLAKFIASLLISVTMIALTLAYPATLQAVAEPSWGPIVSGYAGLVLLAAALTSMGIAVSAWTSNQVVAAAFSMGLFLLLWVMDSLAQMLPDPFDNFFVNFSLLAHFTPLATGGLYLSDVGYFLTLTMLGLLFALRSLARR
jgi:ABC-2 type transport system permease protein